jgi:hypothetical protein
MEILSAARYNSTMLKMIKIVTLFLALAFIGDALHTPRVIPIVKASVQQYKVRPASAPWGAPDEIILDQLAIKFIKDDKIKKFAENLFWCKTGLLMYGVGNQEPSEKLLKHHAVYLEARLKEIKEER